MRFSRLITPAALVLSTSISFGMLPYADAWAQQPGETMPPTVTVPQDENAPLQPLPPAQDLSQQPADAAAQAENADKSPQHKIDDLLASLRRERDPDKARDIATQLQAEWTQSGSATTDLLLQWASEAVEAKRNGAALDFLDRATLISPDFPGAWQQRATLHYTMGDRRKAMADINEVLKREPRHFGAIAGMAAILMESGDDALAHKALERYLAIYPADREAREQLEKIAEKQAGSRT